jgi:two-component system, OmpR family, sensor kinase
LKPTGSLGSYIRSAARGTFSAYRSVPIRWRLAGGSAALTFVILASFAVIVGALTNRQVHTQFDDQLSATIDHLARDVSHEGLRVAGTGARPKLDCPAVSLGSFAEAVHAQIRLFDSSDHTLLCSTQPISRAKGSPPPSSAQLFDVYPLGGEGPFNEAGYRVTVRSGIHVKPRGTELTVVYAQPLSDVDQTLARVQAFLLLGVLGGAVLALLAGLFVSDRAMSPIKELTSAAREIGRTEDATRRVPHPEAEDEIAELARTLEGMLGALDASRSRTQMLLDRQREFVADASHELRTPLTSVLANLELLTEELSGEQAETAEAALRSTRRMRRLVGDLLLLARADAARSQPHRRTDLGQVLIEAAAELGPMADRHELQVHAEPALVAGVRDELHRLILNLLENAMRHTPPGTRVCAATSTDGETVTLVVEDSGPGIPADLSTRVFERFVRGGRDGGRGSGLGLAIVRSVAESHGGTVRLEPSALATAQAPGTRFYIELPALAADAPLDEEPGALVPAADLEEPAAEPPADQTSTTTGRTIGRRRNRS